MGLLAQTRQLLLYTLWADRVCLDAVRDVPPEALTGTPASASARSWGRSPTS